MTAIGCQNSDSFKITKYLLVLANIYIAHLMHFLAVEILNNITSIRLYQFVKV